MLRFTLGWKRLAGLFVVTASLSIATPTPSATAQQPDVATVQVTAARVEGSEVIASLSVTDRAGVPIADLAATGVAATVNGQAARISSLTAGVDPSLPLALVLAIDTSGSMTGAPLVSAKQAIRPLIQSIQPGDRVAILDFATIVAVTAPFSSDPAVLVRALDSLFAAGDTALFGAVAQAAALSATAPEPRKAVVLLSDGENFGVGAATTRAQALAAAQATGVPFYVVALGNQLDTQFLQELSSTTNGQLFASTSTAQLASLYATIADRLRKQYTVRVEVPPGTPTGTQRVAFAVGTARGEASFSFTAPTVAPTVPRLSRLTGPLAEPATVRLEPTAAGKITFLLDGSELEAAGDGSVRIDPLKLNPASTHTLEVLFEHLGAPRRDIFEFQVAALAPRLSFPPGQPVVKAGETIRPELVAQPGRLSITYLIDGRERDSDSSPPFEFAIPPASELGGGAHTLRIVLEGAGGTTEQDFAFSVVIPSQSRRGAYVVLALFGLAALAAGVYGGRRWLAGRQPTLKPTAQDTEALGARASAMQRAGSAPQHTAHSTRATPIIATGAWGVLTLMNGEVPGRTFELRDHRELVGRGKFCSVRINDRSLAEAHFVIGRGGELVTSLPGLLVEVGGVQTRRVQLANGDQVRVGTVVLVYSASEG